MSKDGRITLNKPLMVSGAKVSSLVMREPTVEDQIVMDEMTGSDIVKEVAMFANLCQMAPEDIRKLTLKDYRQLQEVFKAFVV
jgi:hypothetical protein